MPILNTALTLKDLPPPPPGKTGWPWTDQTDPLPQRMPDGSEWPRISIVTPSYNQGQFIEESIRSVLLQGYPNLEYIIIDGGSTDNTVDVIKKYDDYLAYWVSEPDEGQANALNKGFRKVTGQLIGWQNSDDYYYSEAFIHAAQAAVEFKNIDVVYGAVNVIDEKGELLRTIAAPDFKLEDMFPWFKIFNESMFFRRKILEKGKFINESFKHYIDYEYFWQLIFAGYKFNFVPGITSCRRIHPNAKGSTQHYIAAKELLDTYKIAYAHTELPLNVKQIILECSRGICLDNFSKLRLDLFRKSFHDLISMSGASYYDPQLLFRYLLSFLGVKNIKNLKKIWDLRHRVVQ